MQDRNSEKENVVLRFTKVRDVKIPTMGTSGSAGIDFFVPNDCNSTLMPNQSELIPSGIKVNIPDGYYLHGANKGSIGSKGLVLGACIIDNDFKGEIFIDIHNISNKILYITPGMKLAQFILLPFEHVDLIEYESEDELYKNKTSERGEGMLGSTNKQDNL